MLSKVILVVTLLMPNGQTEYIVAPVNNIENCKTAVKLVLKGPAPQRIEVGCYKIYNLNRLQ